MAGGRGSGGDEAVAALKELTADPEHRRQATAAREWLTMPAHGRRDHRQPPGH
jgi:hypothetical protein